MQPTNEQLTAEITTDQANLGYAGKSADEQAALLNALVVHYSVTVPTGEVHNFLLATGIYGKLLDAYHNHANLQVRIIAEEAIDTVMGQIPEIDLAGNSTIVQGMQELGQVGVLTSGDAASIIALAARTRSRAAELWGDGTVVHPQEIEAAGRWAIAQTLLPKLAQVDALQWRSNNAANNVSVRLQTLATNYRNGMDGDVPEWAELVAIYNNTAS